MTTDNPRTRTDGSHSGDRLDVVLAVPTPDRLERQGVAVVQAAGAALLAAADELRRADAFPAEADLDLDLIPQDDLPVIAGWLDKRAALYGCTRQQVDQ